MELIAAIAAITAAAFIRPLREWRAAAFVLVVALSAISRWVIDIETTQARTWVVDMASSGVRLSVVQLVVIVLLLLTTGAKNNLALGRAWLLCIPFFIFLALAYLVAWDAIPDVRGGVLAAALAPAAWVLGARLAPTDGPAPKASLIIAVGLLATLCVQAVVAGYQWVTDSGVLEGRANGTFSHPAWLGKYVLLLLPILLPLATSGHDSRTRKIATVGILLGALGTGLTLSRANLVALALVLVAWSVAGRALAFPRSRSTWRFLVPLAGLAVLLPFASFLLDRFLLDPDGGDRDALQAAGLRVIRQNLLFGTGPNNYVNVAALTEPIVRTTGFPVHNSLLFAIASLGLLGAACIAIPLVSTLRRAGSSVRSGSDFVANTGRAYIVCSLGALFVSMSGWGFWQDPILTLVFLVSGYVYRICPWHVPGMGPFDANAAPVGVGHGVARQRLRIG